MFLFIISIIHDFNNSDKNSLFDIESDVYFKFLRERIREHYDIKPKVLSTAKQLKNLILVQLESYAFEFIKKPLISPYLKNFTDQYELIYPINVDKYAINSLGGSSVTQVGIPMICADISWEDMMYEFNFLNGLQGLPDILNSFNYKMEFAYTTGISIMGFWKWVLSHKYIPIYKAKNDIYLYNYFTNGYFEKIDKRARNSNFKNLSLTYIVNANTHWPYGRPKWCKLPFPQIQEKEKCFHCLDNVLGKFIQKFLDLKMYEHTILVLYPDHPPFDLPQKELYIFLPGINKSDYIKNFKGDFSYYDFAPTIMDMIGIKNYIPEFIYGRNIYDPSIQMKNICVNESCFQKHRKPDSNDLTIIYNYLHFERGKDIKKNYDKDRKFKCKIENSDGNITYYYSDKPCF